MNGGEGRREKKIDRRGRERKDRRERGRGKGRRVRRRRRGRRKERRRRRRRTRRRLRRWRRWGRQQRRERREREKKRHHINRTTPKIDDAQVGGGGWAVEEVGNGVAGKATFRAKRDVGETGSGAVGFE